MSLTSQENDTPLIKVYAADSNSSSGYDVKRHTDDDGMLAQAATSMVSAFDPTTIRRTSQDEALFQQVARPLPMTQLQTDFIAKTMLDIRKSYAAASSSSNSNIGHHKRQKTETMDHANNRRSSYYNTDDFDAGDNYKDEILYSHEEYYGGSTFSSDDDHEDDDDEDDDDSVSLSSLSLPRPSSFDIVNELETHHKTIQFIATAGGLITHWNEAFAIMMNKSKYFPSSSSFSIKSSNSIKSSGSSSSHGHGHHPPLTIFDLVDSHSLPLLYSMIAMSLHNVPIVEVELFRPCDHYNNCYSDDDDYNPSSIVPKKKTTKQSSNKTISSSSSSSSSHMSITLPCKVFYISSLLYNITIVLLPAVAASQGCFLGILTPIITAPTTITTTTTTITAASLPIRVTEHKEKEEEMVAMMVSRQQQHYCHDGPPCRPYYPKFACGKVLSIDDKFLCQLLLGSK